MYIEVDSVEDIDLSKITTKPGPNSIENRYVDKEGKRYALRFNRRKRKIEIVRIALGMEEALMARQKNEKEFESNTIHQSSNEAESEIYSEVPDRVRMKLPDWIKRKKIEPNTDIDPESYFNGIDSNVNLFLERLRGILATIRNTEIMSRERHGGKDLFLEQMNFFENDIQSHFDETQNIVVEFQKYPKTVAHYIGNIPRHQKAWVEKMSSQEQMEYFKAFFTGETLLKALGNSFTLLENINRVTDSVEASTINENWRKHYTDMISTLEFVHDNLFEETSKLLGLFKIAKLI